MSVSSMRRQLVRKRIVVERRMFHRLDTQRAVLTPSPGAGEPDVETYEPYLTNVRGRFIPDAQIEVERGGRVMRERRSVVLVPWMTDINPGDLVSEVRDSEGNVLNTATLSILGIDKPDSHFELRIEEVGAA